ncbi:hypothetical protein Taro_036144 [Colocasia esculenta]|uniref:Uncharacterized protein n=1 Tax=Colocasia esculenta TaxID=4460 RepID=A0A843WGY4_COLES|nr:hypothetical protein [Colocasia esculenta]
MTPKGAVVSRCVGPTRWRRCPAVRRDLVTARFLVATGFLSRCPSPSRWYRDGLGGRDSTCVCLGWGTRQVTLLHSVTEGDTFVAVSWRHCQEGRVYLIIDSPAVN